MKLCHVCNAECEDDAELCPICGAELVLEEKENGNADAVEVIIDNPVLAASAEDVITAEIFCDMLKENGIEHTCDEENGETGMRLMVGGGFAAINIYVAEENLERAQEIYEKALESSAEYDESENTDGRKPNLLRFSVTL